MFASTPNAIFIEAMLINYKKKIVKTILVEIWVGNKCFMILGYHTKNPISQNSSD